MENLLDRIKNSNLVRGIKKGVGIGLTGAILCGAPSCATMTKAQRMALFGDALTIFGTLAPGNGTQEGENAKEFFIGAGAVTNKQAQMQQELDVAQYGSDKIIINNNPPPNQNYNNPQNYQNQNENYPSNNYAPKDNSTPEGLFMYRFWIDDNLDGQGNRTEYKGLNEPVYDLWNLEDLKFSFNSGRAFDGVCLDLRIYSLEDGKIINLFTGEGDVSTVQDFKCKGVFFPNSGKYRAVLNTENKKTFYLDFEVIKRE